MRTWRVTVLQLQPASHLKSTVLGSAKPWRRGPEVFAQSPELCMLWRCAFTVVSVGSPQATSRVGAGNGAGRNGPSEVQPATCNVKRKLYQLHQITYQLDE